MSMISPQGRDPRSAVAKAIEAATGSPDPDTGLPDPDTGTPAWSPGGGASRARVTPAGGPGAGRTRARPAARTVGGRPASTRPSDDAEPEGTDQSTGDELRRPAAEVTGTRGRHRGHVVLAAVLTVVALAIVGFGIWLLR